MSQEVDSPPRTPPSRSRAAESSHLSSGGFSSFQKPNNVHLQTPFLNFMKRMRREMLDRDPGTSKRVIMKTVIKAWSALKPEVRASYGANRTFNPPAIPANHSPLKPSDNSDFGEEETGHSDSFPVDRRIGWATKLRGVISTIANYFVVRPF